MKPSETLDRISRNRSALIQRKRLVMASFALILLVTFFLCLGFGNYQISTHEIWMIFKSKLFGLASPIEEVKTNIVWSIRLPRLLLSIFVGMGLSISGLVFQGVFKNPLVEPYVLGVSSGAAFGAALSIVFSFLTIELSSILFALLSVFLCHAIAFDKNETPIIRLLLSGVIVSTIFSALLNLLKIMASNGELREIVFWLMGGLYVGNWESVVKVSLATGIIFLLFFQMAWKLNLLSLNEEEALSLGLNPFIYKTIFIFFATFLTAICVSQVGIISWIGLMIPHICRMLFGADHRYLLPSSAIFGGLFLLIADTLARTLVMGEIPISIITSLIGSPYLIYLLRKKRSF